MQRVRRALAKGTRAFRRTPGRPGVHEVTASAWYDAAFLATPSYRLPYWQSDYYFAWSVIGDRLARSGKARVLEVGCGTGQLAQLLVEWGVESYTGFDFSEVAVEIAREQVPEATFLVADARTTGLFESINHDWIVCTEVLEHIEFDLDVINRFPPGVRVLCTVPSFDYTSHVRFFANAREVELRYGDHFDDFSVRTLRMPKDGSQYYFLLEGVRSGTGQTG